MKQIFLILLIFTVFIKCDDVTKQEKFKKEVVVNFVLYADSLKQKALLSYTQKIDEGMTSNQFINNIAPIDYAEFYINNIKLQNISTDSLKNNNKCYSNFPLITECFNYFTEDSNAILQDKNNLQIKVDNKIITGTTIIPGNFSIKLNHKKLSWSSSSDAFIYRISATAINEDLVQPFEETTFDTTITLNIKDFKPDTYKITVEALDKNLFNFLIKENFHAGLQNAFGVFGSVRIKKIKKKID